jgi:hypothetical protein
MKSLLLMAGLALIYTSFALSSCATHEEAKAPPAKPAPAAEAKTAPSKEKASPQAKAGEAKEKAEKAPATAKAEEAKAEKTEKAKAEKVKGDIGLLDTEKNYMILVTKEGKLITLDFDQKTKATMIEPKDAKMSDVGLGSAAEIEYVTQGEKKLVTKMEFRPAKGE